MSGHWVSRWLAETGLPVVRRERTTAGGKVWVAWFPGEEGCAACGATPVIAVARLREIIPRYRSALRDIGAPAA